jgi:DNA-directed RNA polymerase subunit RPC12/RpoP
MSVYVRYPCPNCPRHLSLRLEYVNRRVVCNHCKHPFLSRARIRVPASATPELIDAINAANRAQGFSAVDREGADEPGSPSPLELVISGDVPQPEPSGREGAPDPESRVAELERALAKAEVRHAQRFEQARAIWEQERRALEDEADLLGVQYSRQLDDERALQVRQRETLRRERDDALRRVEAMTRERGGLAERVAELAAERDGLLAQRSATAAELDRLGTCVVGLEQALGEARTRHAEELGARREEERRALAQAAERLARERENSSEQLRDVLSQLEDALAQVEIARHRLATERETVRREIEATYEPACSPNVAQERPSGEALERYQVETERLAGEIERVRNEKEAESTRCRELAERAQQLEAELEQARLAHESEAQARRLAVEELQILLNYRLRSDRGSDALDLEGNPTSEHEHEHGDDDGDLDPMAGPAASEPPGAATEDEPTPALSLSPAPGRNPSDSPDERIAALRAYLRRVREQEEARMNRGFLRRLARAWRPSEPK